MPPGAKVAAIGPENNARAVRQSPLAFSAGSTLEELVMELSAVNDVHQTSPASLLADLATGQTKDQSGGPHEGLGKVLHRTHLPAITRAMNEWQAMKAQPSDTEARNPMHKTRFTEKRHAPVDQSHVVTRAINHEQVKAARHTSRGRMIRCATFEPTEENRHELRSGHVAEALGCYEGARKQQRGTRQQRKAEPNAHETTLGKRSRKRFDPRQVARTRTAP